MAATAATTVTLAVRRTDTETYVFRHSTAGALLQGSSRESSIQAAAWLRAAAWEDGGLSQFC